MKRTCACYSLAVPTVAIWLSLSACASRAESEPESSTSAPSIDITFRELGQAKEWYGSSNNWWYESEKPKAFALQGVGVLTEGAYAPKGTPQEHHGEFGSPAPTFRIRALPDGKVVSELGTVKPGVESSYGGPVYAITADQKYCATLTAKGDLRLWDSSDGRLVGDYLGLVGDYAGEGAIDDSYRLSVAVSPGRTYVAAAGGDAIVWEYANRRIAGRIPPPAGGGIVDVGFSPDGSSVGLAVAGQGTGFRSKIARIEVRELTTWSVTGTVDVGPCYFASSGFIATDGHWYYGHFTGTDDTKTGDTLHMYDLKAGMKRAEFYLGRKRSWVYEGFPRLVAGGDYVMVVSRLSPDARHSIFRGSSDAGQMLHVYDLVHGKLMKKVPLPKGRECMVLAADGSHMLTLDYGGAALVYGALPAYTREGPLRWWEIRLSGLPVADIPSVPVPVPRENSVCGPSTREANER